MQSPAEARRPVFMGTEDGAHKTLEVAAAWPAQVCQLYEQADDTLRGQVLVCLLQPLGPLALTTVASGAFRGFLPRPGGPTLSARANAARRFSAEEMQELARFAFEIDPRVLLELDSLLTSRSPAVQLLPDQPTEAPSRRPAAQRVLPPAQ